MKRVLWWVALAIAANGCAPLMMQQEATTLDPGKIQVGAALGGSSERIKSPAVTGGGKSTESLVPSPLAWVRRGLASGVDAGLRFYQGGAGADVKVAAIRSDMLTIAVDGGAGGYWDDASADGSSGNGIVGGAATTAWEADGNLLATFRLGTMPLTAGLRALRSQVHGLSGGGHGTDTIDYLGGFAGVTLHAGALAIHPELAVYQSDYHVSGVSDPRGVLFLPSVGLSSSF